MVLETERQKCNRKLEKAEKALADAMWRKKKKEHLQGRIIVWKRTVTFIRIVLFYFIY